MSTIKFDAATSSVTINGTSEADLVEVSSDATQVYVSAVTAGSTVSRTYAKSSVALIKFNGGDGDDQFTNNTDIASTAFGQGGNDTLLGGTRGDRLFGGAGDDALDGRDGNDELRGEDGNDILVGGAGNDELVGGAGNNTLRGGLGDDTLLGGDGVDNLYGEDGNDRLIGGAGNDTLDGGTGADTLFGGLGDDTLFGGDGADNLRGEDGNDYLSGGAGNDNLVGGAGFNVLLGEVGDDVLLGGDDNDVMYGGNGNDRLIGGGGNDQLDGGAGADLLLGGLGDDTLFGGDGNDNLQGEAGNDRLYGDRGLDTLDGGAGNDILSGGAHDDILIGGDGDDDLRGDAGNDRLTGGNGNDVLSGGAGNDRLLGGLGNDILDGGIGNDELRGEEGNDRLMGGRGNDILVGGSGQNQLYGGSDNDVLHGGDGADILRGNDGDDLIKGGSGNDNIDGGSGNDRLFGELGDDIIYGGTGNDVLRGEEGNDRMLAGSGKDELDGGMGNDVLVGGADDDTLVGSYGHDVLIGGLGADNLKGNSDNDLLLGGISIYDNDVSKLRMLSLAWSASTPVARRIEQIESELFSARMMSEETVFDDAASDTVFGGGGEDWFLQTGYLGVYVPQDVHVHDHEEEETDDTTNGGHSHPGPIILDHPPELEGFDLVSAIDVLGDRIATESIQTLLPHADGGALQREHLTLFELVRYDQVTHYALHGGAWSDPTTWHGGVIPSNGARVLIPLNVTVTVDGVIDARLQTIRVDGKLSFDTTQDTELKVDTIVVSSTGAFEMGTEANPVPSGVIARLMFTDDGPIDRTVDPLGIGRGLISHGSVSIHGAEVTGHAALTAPAIAGATELVMNVVPIGWHVGDTIVVAGTTAGVDQNEVRKIVSISGNWVRLNQALAYNHETPGFGLEAHVANLTRNVVIESESTVIDRRGHTMFMHNRAVDIAYAGFYGLGRTNKLKPINDAAVNADWSLQAGTGTNVRGRYAVHFHRNGLTNDGKPSVIKGSAVVDAGGWGFVNHSSYVDILDNVAYDVKGAAFSTEVGDEIGSFRGNIAIGSTGSGEVIDSRRTIQDFGHQGDGFWFQGSGVSVTDNIAAGNEGNAFVFYVLGLIEDGDRKKFVSANLEDPSIANGAEMIDTRHVPIPEFDNNIGYSSRIGLNLRYVLEHATHSEKSVYENSQFWNNTEGVFTPYSNSLVLRNLTIVRSPTAALLSAISGNSLTKNMTYENLTVSGYRFGIEVPISGYSIINGGSYNTSQDIIIMSGKTPDRSVTITGFTTTPKIKMSNNLRAMDGSVAYLFQPDIVTLNFGPFQNQRLYYLVQAPDAIPFPEMIEGLDPRYVGLTSQQIWNLDNAHVAVGGALAPADAYTVPNITGLIGPAS